MRGYLVILVAAVGIACEQAATPPSPSIVQTSGFFTNGPVQLSCRLDVPAHSGPFGAVVFGHGSGTHTRNSCRFLADGFLSRGFGDRRGVRG